MKLEFSGQIVEKYSKTKFQENPFSESRVVPCGRTDKHDKVNRRFFFEILQKRLKCSLKFS
jgi:hypothetical protein